MRPRKTFRFSDSWTLEDRIALSQGGVAAEVASAVGLHAAFRGKVTTRLPSGLGGGETASLNGSAHIVHFGMIHLHGRLQSNGSLPPPDSNTSGVIILTAPRPHHGHLVLDVTGPPSDLAPQRTTTTPLSYTVASATGDFTRLPIGPGTASLTLHTRRGPQRGHVSHGTFTLVPTNLA
jgi:hypothetical protein